MKKRLLAALLAVISAVSMTGYAIADELPASTSCAANVDADGKISWIDLNPLEVGDIIYVGDIAIQRAADDDEGPNPMARSAQVFNIKSK